MRHSLTRWLITLVLIWSWVSLGSAVQAGRDGRSGGHNRFKRSCLPPIKFCL